MANGREMRRRTPKTVNNKEWSVKNGFLVEACVGV